MNLPSPAKIAADAEVVAAVRAVTRGAPGARARLALARERAAAIRA